MKLKSNQDRSIDFLKRGENNLILKLHVKPNSNKNFIKITQQEMIIACNSPAVKDKANKSVIRLLSNFFNVSKNCIHIISGLKSRNKTIQIITEDDISLDPLIKKLNDAINGETGFSV